MRPFRGEGEFSFGIGTRMSRNNLPVRGKIRFRHWLKMMTCLRKERANPSGSATMVQHNQSVRSSTGVASFSGSNPWEPFKAARSRPLVYAWWHTAENGTPTQADALHRDTSVDTQQQDKEHSATPSKSTEAKPKPNNARQVSARCPCFPHRTVYPHA